MSEVQQIGPLANQIRQDMKASGEHPVSKFLRLKIDADTARVILKDWYEEEVTSRGRAIVWDEQTQTAIDYASNWLFARNRDGLLLYGKYGNGKTTLMNCLRRLFRKDRFLDEVPLVTTTMIIDDMSCRCSGEENLYRRCLDAGILFIDEVGVEEGSSLVWGTRRTPVQDIIVYRYDRRLITVLSSNLDDDGLLAKYGHRVLDRLGESYTRIAYTQSSYRELE